MLSRPSMCSFRVRDVRPGKGRGKENRAYRWVTRLSMRPRNRRALSLRPCHARGEDQLRGHVELLRCHYSFGRPHRALKFGRACRMPAMQAGVASTRLTWSDIFTVPGLSRHLGAAVVRILVAVLFMDAGPTVSWPHDYKLAARSTASGASTAGVRGPVR